MLLEQTGSTTARTNETMNLCVETMPNPKRAERCRHNFIQWLKDGLNLVGLQVYYTKGASLYERFRTCTESFICDNDCTEKFNRFFQANELIKGRLNSMGNDQKDLDFYVNFRFTGVTDKKLMVHCCSNYLRKKFEYRPTPGNDAVLNYVGLVFPETYLSRMTLEMSGPVTALQGNF
ncbi:unnamed protein product [Lymnaea stagnalis]|uniref:Uncharacterized protein n=1 Tax=Lymnaea stagnalis TaxID=6523 RepID=A0AAV2ILJ5_LYMST